MSCLGTAKKKKERSNSFGVGWVSLKTTSAKKVTINTTKTKTMEKTFVDPDEGRNMTGKWLGGVGGGQVEGKGT